MRQFLLLRGITVFEIMVCEWGSSVGMVVNCEVRPALSGPSLSHALQTGSELRMVRRQDG